MQTVFLLLSVSLLGKTHAISFEGLSVFAYDGVELRSFLVASIVNDDDSITMFLSSEIFARGTGSLIDIHFRKLGFPSPSIESAVAVVDVIYHYVGDKANVEVGTYYNRFLVSPTNTTDEIFYRIDFTPTINDVFAYFSAKVNNLTIQDVAIGGRFSISNKFDNSTNAVLDRGYVRFSYIFEGNMRTVILDFTAPRPLIGNAKFGNEDMTKVFPNRVQKVFSVGPTQRIESEMYMEWQIPEPLPPPPFFVQHPWIIPLGTCLLGLALGHFWNNVLYPRYFKPHSHLRVLYSDSFLTIDNSMGKVPVEWAAITVRPKNTKSNIKSFRINGSLSIRKPEPYTGGNSFWVIVENITPKDWGSIEIEIDGPLGIEVEVKSSSQNEKGGKQTIGYVPSHGEWGEEESFENWLRKHGQ